MGPNKIQKKICESFAFQNDVFLKSFLVYLATDTRVWRGLRTQKPKLGPEAHAPDAVLARPKDAKAEAWSRGACARVWSLDQKNLGTRAQLARPRDTKAEAWSSGACTKRHDPSEQLRLTSSST